MLRNQLPYRAKNIFMSKYTPLTSASRRRLLLSSAALLTTTLAACGGSDDNRLDTGAAQESSAATPAPPPATTSSIDAQSRPFPGGWIWKPHSEGTGTLVVLAPGIRRGTKLSIVNAQGKVVGRVIRATTWEGRKSSWYFDRHGKSYPRPCYLKINSQYHKISNGANRIG